MSNLVQNPYPMFYDADGNPLEAGYVHIGEPGLNPLSNPLQAYWDAALTIPATNIRTSSGYLSNSGTPGRVYTGTNYSIVVQDKNGVIIYSQLNSLDFFNSPSDTIISSVDTIAELRGIVPSEPNLQVSLAGETTVGDGLTGPLFYWDATSSETDNGYSIIKPTAVTGDGRWLWINTNAPKEVVNITSSGTLDLAFKNRIFLVDTALAITLAVPDGDFPGQAISIANKGVSTLDLTGSGITGSASVFDEVLLLWVGSSWSLTYPGVGARTVDGEQLITSIVEMGPWDMDTLGSFSFAHGIADPSKIRKIDVMILDDAQTTIAPLTIGVAGVLQGEINSIGPSNVNMSRLAGGSFDIPNYDDPLVNRGWMTISYLE